MRPLPVGEHGLLIELDDAEEVEALHAELLRRAAAGALPWAGGGAPSERRGEIVPAARTVFLDGLADPADWSPSSPPGTSRR